MHDNKQPTNQRPVSGSLVPEMVKDIPIAVPGAKPRAGNEDDELDKIMRDVGQDIKQIDKKKPKHHWFGGQKKSKAEVKFSARPIDPIKPLPSAPPKPQDIAPQPQPASPKPTPAIKAKPAKTSHAPVGIVILAMLVTFGLMAAAYFAYK
ncbi:MAG TPA: hypothetical protein VFH37_00650 [Candidatus Saccharimonadales bacterium]|nr:hypothetical protein [Candidatus Saccharimonadales bacterium]